MIIINIITIIIIYLIIIIIICPIVMICLFPLSYQSDHLLLLVDYNLIHHDNIYHHYHHYFCSILYYTILYYIYRCKQLQTTLDLQIGSSSLKERQLTSEMENYKLEYEKLDNNFKYQKVIHYCYTIQFYLY